MANARLSKELYVKAENKVGMLAEVASAISEAGINIQAICAYGMEKDAYFMIVTSDNKKAAGVLKAKGCSVDEKEVVLLDLENKPGAAKQIAEKIKASNINLSYIYGTTHGTGPALIILNSDNNAGIVNALK